MYTLFREALRAAGITWRHRDRLIDRGDGILALIHPADNLPKTLLLNRTIPTLARLLAEHNSGQSEHCLRLRAAVHAGEVHYDSRGCFGEALDLTCRLLDAPTLKSALRHTASPLVLVVSDLIYQSVVRHGYPGIDQHAFHPLIQVRVAARDHSGWFHDPGEQPMMSQARKLVLARQWLFS